MTLPTPRAAPNPDAFGAGGTTDERYRELFSAIDQGFCVAEVIFDDDGQAVDHLIVECNSAFERHTGVAHAAGRLASELVPGGEAIFNERYGHVATTGESVRFVQGSDVMQRWFEVFVSRIGDNTSRTIGILFSDISERKQIEQALAHRTQQFETAALALSEADVRKDEFLAMLAHELRNPLAPIYNALQILQLAEFNPQALRVAAGIIDRQTTQMIRLVDELLDVSRISRGTIELRRGTVELASILQQVVETSRPALEQAQHAFTLSLPPHPLYLNGDAVRLVQIFGNLLNNAGKFTEPGGRIELFVQQEGAEIVVTVRDSGVGIPDNMLVAVFEMFRQVDHSLERRQSGLGIGLSLVHRLVELHGGSVTASSAGLGTGSQFVVRLPIATAPLVMAEENDSRPSPRAFVQRRVLVVDDNHDSADSLALYLQLLGNDTRTAYDGLEALESAENFRPHLVLLDIGMPRLNGYNAARQMRAEAWGASMIIVALSGWGQASDRLQSKDAGFDEHFVKPVNHETLASFIAGMPSAA